jgi:hypothetical protein
MSTTGAIDSEYWDMKGRERAAFLLADEFEDVQRCEMWREGDPQFKGDRLAWR